MTATDMEKQQFNVYLPRETVRRIKHRAIDSGTSLSRLVEGVFESFLTAPEGGEKMSTSITTYYYTEDPQRLRSFYERALGVQAVAESVDWAEFDVGGAHLAVHRQRPEDPRDMAVPHVDLSVDDIEGAVARFRAAGAGVVREISDASYGRTAVLRDPDGREITLVQVTLP